MKYKSASVLKSLQRIQVLLFKDKRDTLKMRQLKDREVTDRISWATQKAHACLNIVTQRSGLRHEVHDPSSSMGSSRPHSLSSPGAGISRPQQMKPNLSDVLGKKILGDYLL